MNNTKIIDSHFPQLPHLPTFVMLDEAWILARLDWSAFECLGYVTIYLDEARLREVILLEFTAFALFWAEWAELYNICP